jgi:hypothetical protein
MVKLGSSIQAGSEVVAGGEVVVATGGTTVDELKTLDELEELEELDDLGGEAVLLIARGTVLQVAGGGGVASTAYNCTCLQDEPRLNSNLGVRTARIPAQSAKRLVI